MVKLKRIPICFCISILGPVFVLVSASTLPPSPQNQNQEPFRSPQGHEGLNEFSQINITTPSDSSLLFLNTTFHTTFHPLSHAYTFLIDLEKTFPALVQLERVGVSSEGREIVAAVIKRKEVSNKKGVRKKKNGFVVMGTQHAREWIATSTALYLAHALAVDAQEKGSLNRLLDNFDFYIIPIPNPDGYKYTWEVDRFWYKNRMPVGHTQCHGLDMNRNWGFSWEPSSSPNEGPCEPWYPGTRPFQAPEVKALSAYFKSLENVKAFIDLRSYGQMVSTPYSYSCGAVPPDAEDMLEAAHGAAAAMRLVHGTPVKAGMLCDMLYPAPGNILDWMYVDQDIKYSYAVHLRDTGTYGYALPQHWIRPVGEETAGLVSYVVEFICHRRRGNKTECEL